MAGYSKPVKPIQEEELFNVLPTFRTDRCDVTLFSAKKKVDIDDMPGIVGNIGKIEGSLLKIDEWTNLDSREPLVPQPTPFRPRRDPAPPRPEPRTSTNSAKKIIQRFNYQFKALADLVDENHMEQASVDQAEAMLKALETMRSNLDKFDDIEFEDIIIEGKRYNNSDTMQTYMKSIFKAKDRNKKREKKEERLKSDKMKRLLQFSLEFPTKLEDDASVFGLYVSPNYDATPLTF